MFWLGDNYLNTHTNVGQTKEETQKLLEEHNSFKEKAKETREKVKLLLQLADTLMEKGHAHAPSIKSWVEEVDETYKDFSTRMDKYRSLLEAHLGIPSVQDPLSLDNTSITSKDSLDSGHVTASSRLSSTSEATSTSNNLQVRLQLFPKMKDMTFSVKLLQVCRFFVKTKQQLTSLQCSVDSLEFFCHSDFTWN